MNSKPTRQEKAEAKRLEPLTEKIVAINQKIIEAQDRHERAMGRLKAIRSRLRQECTHPIINEQRDPSGGSDHAYTCKVCGGMLVSNGNEWRAM